MKIKIIVIVSLLCQIIISTNVFAEDEVKKVFSANDNRLVSTQDNTKGPSIGDDRSDCSATIINSNMIIDFNNIMNNGEISSASISIPQSKMKYVSYWAGVSAIVYSSKKCSGILWNKSCMTTRIEVYYDGGINGNYFIHAIKKYTDEKMVEYCRNMQ